MVTRLLQLFDDLVRLGNPWLIGLLLILIVLVFAVEKIGEGWIDPLLNILKKIGILLLIIIVVLIIGFIILYLV